MPTWPSPVSTTGMDADTDGLPRSDILDLTTKFNEVIALRGAAGGICDLDGSGKVPTTRLEAKLAAIAGLTGAANKGLHFTGVGAAALHDQTAFARTQFAASDAAGGRTVLGAAASGAVTSSGLTQATGKLLGRLTAAAGAIEELTVNDFTEDATPDLAADFLLAYDTSAGAMKKVKPANLGGGGMDLLGTLTTTSGTTQTLSGLTLTDYKMLYISIDGVSNNVLLLGSVDFSYGSIVLGAVSGVAYDGHLFTDLLSGYTSGSFNGTAIPAATTSYTTASTSVVFSLSGGASFDAGVIKIYGVK